MIKKLFFVILGVFSLYSLKINFHHSPTVNAQKNSFSLKFEPLSDEFIYRESLHISSNNPNIELDEWNPDIKPEKIYDKQFKEQKEVFSKDFTINGTYTCIKKESDQALVIRYLSNKMQAPTYTLFSLQNTQPKLKSSSKNPKKDISFQKSTEQREEGATCPTPHQKKRALSDHIQQLIATTSSLWIKFLFVFLLGILMSLTPCIYPMIPITVGILQAQGRKSMRYNFFLAFSYMLGIALMFATLGLGAAVTGSLFGKLMSKPPVVIIVVLMLLYLAFSMFGFYELKLPSFNLGKKTNQPRGSVISAFLFGIASGTIASPCLSPGLAFLLSIVATLGNKILGFFLLFTFGIGMSIPLLLIGTFSTALKFMPKTGTWMIEVKKIFGLLILALCFYYLSNIVSLTVLLWLIATTLLIAGLYELINSKNATQNFNKYFRIFIGISSLIASGLTYFKAIQQINQPLKTTYLVKWMNNYDHAKTQAIQEKKLLFIDIGAPYCSICKAIDRCIFNDSYIASLINAMIPVKIDAVNSSEYDHIHTTYRIIGVPTILIVHPETETIIKRWGAELYSMTKNELGADLGTLLQQY